MSDRETRRRLNDEDDAWLKDRNDLIQELARVTEERERALRGGDADRDYRDMRKFQAKFIEADQALSAAREREARLRSALEQIRDRHAPGDGEADFDIARQALQQETEEVG